MMTGNPPWDHMSNKIAVLFHIASAKEPPKVDPRAHATHSS
jgi:hypothetical protein